MCVCVCVCAVNESGDQLLVQISKYDIWIHVNAVGKVVPVHVMKAYGGVKV